jgi:hypothetical protein
MRRKRPSEQEPRKLRELEEHVGHVFDLAPIRGSGEGFQKPVPLMVALSPLAA